MVAKVKRKMTKIELIRNQLKLLFSLRMMSADRHFSFDRSLQVVR